jgi:LysR family transcriptional regulator, transcriptional activator of nhaA
MPGDMTVVRSRLIRWLDSLHIHSEIVGEFDDSALMKNFWRSGSGVFIAPTPIAEHVKKQNGVVSIRQLPGSQRQLENGCLWMHISGVNEK